VERGPWSTVCNLGLDLVQVDLRQGKQELAAVSDAGIILAGNLVTLPPNSVAILKNLAAD
jgi:hypothetical protein